MVARIKPGSATCEASARPVGLSPWLLGVFVNLASVPCWPPPSAEGTSFSQLPQRLEVPADSSSSQILMPVLCCLGATLAMPRDDSSRWLGPHGMSGIEAGLGRQMLYLLCSPSGPPDSNVGPAPSLLSLTLSPLLLQSRCMCVL